jgi:hypothetical protein
MNKIAMYEALLEDHPLWDKEAKMDDSDRKALLAGGVAALGTVGGAYAAHRFQAPRIAREQQKLLKATQRKGRLSGQLFEKYRNQGMSARQAERKIDKILREDPLERKMDKLLRKDPQYHERLAELRKKHEAGRREHAALRAGGGWPWSPRA